MSAEPETSSGLTDQQVGEMTARVARNEADIGALRKDAVEATHRAGVSQGRADIDRHRIEALEARAVLDRELLEELRVDGVLSSDHAANLEVALQTSRLIGAAIGIIMVRCSAGEARAFEILKKGSQDGNRKVRDLAEEIVFTGDVGHLLGKVGDGAAPRAAGAGPQARTAAGAGNAAPLATVSWPAV